MAVTESYLPRGSRLDSSEVQSLTVAADPRHIQKVNAAIAEHTELLALLMFRQPLSGNDIRDFLGISKGTFLRSIRRLIKVGVLTKVSFEQNTLYVIKGQHTKAIHSALNT